MVVFLRLQSFRPFRPPGALLEAVRPQFSRLLYRAGMAIRAAFASIESLADVRGRAAVSLRLGLPMAIGSVLCSDALYALPIWARVFVIAATAVGLVVAGKVAVFDEAWKRATKTLLQVRDARIRTLERSLKRLEARAHQAEQHSAYCEALTHHAWEAETEARRKARHWEAVAVENAAEGVRLAHVMTAQIAQLGGELELQRTPQLLAESEQKN